MASGWGSKSASHGHYTRPDSGRNAGCTVPAMSNVCYKIMKCGNHILCSGRHWLQEKESWGKQKNIYFIRKMKREKKTEH